MHVAPHATHFLFESMARVCAYFWAPSELPGMRELGQTDAVRVRDVFTTIIIGSSTMNISVIAAITLPGPIYRQDLRGYD